MLAVVLFMLCVAATRNPWALAVQAFVAVAVALAVRIPAVWWRRILVLETALFVFALFAALVGTGPRLHLGPLSVSASASAQALAMLARASMGVALGAVLLRLYDRGDLIGGLARLRVPAPLVAIMTLTAQFLGLIGDEARRMSIARAARGGADRGPRARLAATASLGALVIRTMDRAERVSHAMAARGFTAGAMPVTGRPATTVDWLAGALLPVLALAATVSGHVLGLRP